MLSTGSILGGELCSDTENIICVIIETEIKNTFVSVQHPVVLASGLICFGFCGELDILRRVKKKILQNTQKTKSCLLLLSGNH